MQPTLVVLAAGMGSRYGGFKQIDPVGPGGEVILDYSVYDAWRAGFGRVVLVIRPELEAPLRERFAAAAQQIEFRYVMQDLTDVPAGIPVAERDKPWGTGHATLSARGAVEGPFAVINADDFYGPSSYRLLADFFAESAHRAASEAPETCAMVSYPLRNTLSRHGAVSRGVCQVSAEGFLEDIRETTQIARAENGDGLAEGDGAEPVLVPGDTPVSMNFWGFQATLFPLLQRLFAEFLDEHGTEPRTEFYLPAAVDRLTKAGRCRTRVLASTDPWFGMTYKQDRDWVRNGIRTLVEAGAYPEKLWQ